MSSAFPGSPRLLRGGLVLVDPGTGAVLRIIALQYNPDTLTRSLQIKGVSGESRRSHGGAAAQRPAGGNDQGRSGDRRHRPARSGDSGTAESGLHPQLAALETIVYPTSSHLNANRSEAQSGSLEIAPAQGAADAVHLRRRNASCPCASPS